MYFNMSINCIYRALKARLFYAYFWYAYCTAVIAITFFLCGVQLNADLSD
ncbi:hypothetical protein AOR13_559 [Alteromonas stellipolaris LMG 21856]|nr:hypothetical protein AOR13_559 [Alteromonas stellipolaris LMG 21856]